LDHWALPGWPVPACGTPSDVWNAIPQQYTTKLEIRVSDEEQELVVRVSNTAPSLEAFHRDTGTLSVLVRMCRLLCGEQWKPTAVTVTHGEPSDTSYFYSFFRCPVQFDAACNGLRIERDAAQERIAGSDGHLAQLNDHIVTRYLAHRSRTDIVNRVKAATLDTLGDGNTTEKAVADLLQLSPRQLSRKLQSENTNFRTLLSECRRELAEQYLRDSARSLTEIAFLLGFSEASAFSRAYRRWTGMSPTEARLSASAD